MARSVFPATTSAAAAAVACLVLPVAALALDLAGRDWQSDHYQNHPLVGIVVSGEGEVVAPHSLTEAVIVADHVLVGEIHSNPDHHLIQTDILNDMIDATRRPAVVVEMIPASMAEPLAAYLSSAPDNAVGLGRAVEWDARGWPSYTLYRPIFAAALAADLPIVAGDLDRERIRAIGRGEATEDERRRLGLDVPLEAPAEAALRSELGEAHCGQLPADAIGPMLRSQRARDGALAAAMVEAPGDDGAFLVAGSGHVRRDRAVPAILARMAPEKSVVAIGLIEVVPDLTDPGDYAVDRYDFAIFTPRADITDPCENFDTPEE